MVTVADASRDQPRDDSKDRSNPIPIRVFLASPGDVGDERALAIRVLEQLPYDPFLRGKVSLEIVAWDKPGAATPMLVTMTPQEAIESGLPKPSECDIVVVVFWSRMGTPLPTDKYKKADGSRYFSGSEWEFCDALAAVNESGYPKILVYRRTQDVYLNPKDAQFSKKLEQWQRVEQFFDGFRNADGSIRQAHNEYATPDDFENALRSHLKSVLKTLIESPPLATTREASSTERAEPEFWRGSPFPGLRPFTDKDAPIFIGRGRETDGLIRKLNDPDSRFIAVVGASGSGKSSLVWSGLIPRLRGHAAPGGDEKPYLGAIPGSQDWVWVRFTPGEVGDNPFMALATALKPTLEEHGKAPREVAVELQGDVGSLDQWVTRVLKRKPDWAKLLLFVDQFEELFTLVSSHYQTNFVELLARAIALDRVCTIVTMRADFYHRCLEWPVLRAQFENEQWEKSHFPLMAPGTGQLHEMINRPAVRAGLRFEQGLPERILDDTGTEPGALALMAFALAELYEAKTDDGRLTHTAYERFGGVSGAIGKRAEDTFGALEPTVQAKLGDGFRELVEVDERGVATRRRAPLRQITGSVQAQTLVNALTNARLLVTSRGEDEDSVVEVAHEALFRSWPRLEKWVQDTADDLRLRRQIRQLADYWRQHARKDEHRWSDDRVAEAVGMLDHLGLTAEDLPGIEQDFLGPLDRDRMLAELDDPTTPHERRAISGVRLALLGDPRPGVGLRKDGLPDIVWCEVPSGEITLEVDEEKPSRLSKWLGRSSSHSFEVAPFRIAKYPLTYIQYRAFLDAEDGFRNSAWWKGLWFQVNEPGKQFNRRDNHPAENLCWLEAVAFCRWLSEKLGYEIRLPTEWEWQQAATGGDPVNQYPWGPEWDASLANTYESELNRSTAVGIYPQGASPVAALDMAGNVWEWCLNEHENPGQSGLSGDGRRVVRGGAWGFNQVSARATYRLHYVPNLRYSEIGVRLVCLAPILGR
jgi:formylglycine-generating enzyme required for sulfatase activity